MRGRQGTGPPSSPCKHGSLQDQLISQVMGQGINAIPHPLQSRAEDCWVSLFYKDLITGQGKVLKGLMRVGQASSVFLDNSLSNITQLNAPRTKLAFFNADSCVLECVHMEAKGHSPRVLPFLLVSFVCLV